MREFNLVSAHSVEEACSLLKDGAKILAGGTDLVGGMKRDIYPEQYYPKFLVNIQGLQELDYIKEEDGFIKIGAMTKLRDVAENNIVKEKLTALSQAAEHTASPNLRRMGTIGGNICQENRCWYYRSDNNYYACKMKGGKKCYAAAGDNRYHSIYGAVNGCFAVNPSDTAPALLAFGAKIRTSERTIEATDFWAIDVCKSTVLNDGEMVLEIIIPIPKPSTKSSFQKFAKRKTIDFAIVNCAVVIAEEAKVVLNGVYSRPYRATKAEEILRGNKIDEQLAKQAGEPIEDGSKPLKANKFKVQEAKVLVERTILECILESEVCP